MRESDNSSGQTSIETISTKRTDPVIFVNCIFIAMVMLFHQGAYSHSPLTYIRKYSPLTYYVFIQRMAVGGFLFLSGYKLAKSNKDKPSLAFLRARLFRIHPLYCTAVLTYAYFVCPILYKKTPSLTNIVVHLFGIQVLIPVYAAEPYFPTLWFVSVIYICYVLFLLARKYIHASGRLSLTVVIFVCAILLVRFSSEQLGFPVFEFSLADYVLFFFVGVAYSEFELRGYEVSPILCFATFVICTSIFLLYYNSIEKYVSWIPAVELFKTIMVVSCAVFAIIGLFHFGKMIRCPAKMENWLKSFSYATFGMFLFHRQIWGLMEHVWPERSVGQFLYISALGYPIIFTVGYYAQKYCSVLEDIVREKCLSEYSGRRRQRETPLA